MNTNEEQIVDELGNIVKKTETVICKKKEYIINYCEVPTHNFGYLRHNFIRWYTTLNGHFHLNRKLLKIEDCLDLEFWDDFCFSDLAARGQMRDVTQKLNGYNRVFTIDDHIEIRDKILLNTEKYFRIYWGIIL